MSTTHDTDELVQNKLAVAMANHPRLGNTGSPLTNLPPELLCLICDHLLHTHYRAQHEFPTSPPLIGEHIYTNIRQVGACDAGFRINDRIEGVLPLAIRNGVGRKRRMSDYFTGAVLCYFFDDEGKRRRLTLSRTSTKEMSVQIILGHASDRQYGLVHECLTEDDDYIIYMISGVKVEIWTPLYEENTGL